MAPTTETGGVPRRRVLDLLGLSARAGGVVTGTVSVRQAVREARVHRVFLAEDAAPGQRQKLEPLLQARQVPSHILYSRVELGSAVGRSPVSAVGVTDLKLARRIGEMVSALPKGRPAAEP
jgi:ribosomal protein L7Ae-like RNA K-turn-binding protein